MNILGINAVFHESSAALIIDGEIVAACEEERFNRVKHAKQARVDNPHVLPEKAIRFCLNYAGLHACEIDHIAYSFDPRLRRASFRPQWWPDSGWESEFLSRLADVSAAVEAILEREIGDALKFVPHHLAHAASAYYPSGFDSAAILVVDGIGEAACSTLARGDGARIQSLDSFSYPHSLGFVWEQVSAHLGFSPYDAAKVMGLAAYGDPDICREQIAAIIDVREDGYAVDPVALGFPAVDSSAPERRDQSGLEGLLGPPRRRNAEISRRHADIAAALQAETNAAVAALLRRLERATAQERLCLAGGVALNCVTNAQISRMSGFSDIFIPSAPHDAGTAIGAALLVHCAEGGACPRPSASPYLGPDFDEREILAAVRAAGLTPRRSKDPARDAADMIADGNIVAWFQGRMEFGPRALGNRSLLADPRRPDTRAILNRRIKHREDFRPFAPAVLAERADEWFDIGPPSPSREFMLFACPAKAERRDRIPAVIHRDGTARVQIVQRKSNPRFHELISRFFARTGVPLVVNTSFNDSEPIVCTPAQAIHTFRNTGMDALFMGDIYLTSQM
ncbi:carbamoyltransferase C-terminal domain-containing protein [Methylosinus sp. Sm6]|uniref:carbamoyltransferase family protein n=1 Tax=Methylosinus sp. Sm6 TaxID=2866948 RepID=UPI001C9A02C9|nr:carbamoyltransferase C-terminal domain-containing protein [Methylosinus sp. Sm6]MBY6240514.1 carbamoyltransferase [Methylosinus sp. Sm6]